MYMICIFMVMFIVLYLSLYTYTFQDYLSEILNVIYEDNVRVLGYTIWTLMDNFEWRAGFS